MKYLILSIFGILIGLTSTPSKAGQVYEIRDLGPLIRLQVNLDQDNDGLSDAEEERLGIFPDNCDSDEDGLFDGIEAGIIKPANPDIENDCHGLQGAGSNYHNPYLLDPLNPDSDGDGLLDGEEDFNGNGWVDSDESDPTMEDTDRDGIIDGIEAFADFDEDEIPDFDINLIKAGPDCSPPQHIYDLDCDGIPNWVDIDSDGDGCPDSEEGKRVDRNSNNIPDVYDNEAKQCAVASDGGGSVSFGGSGSSLTQEQDEPSTSGKTPAWLTDQSGGSACSLISNSSQASSEVFLLLALLVIFVFRRIGIPIL
ncbi:MAG: hypothetical protein ABH859_08385 [Pseudomonadota bacterium]